MNISRRNNLREPSENQVRSPLTTNDNIIKNPLLSKPGVPVTADDFVDSSERIISATNTNDIRYGRNNDIWNFDSSRYEKTINGVRRKIKNPELQYDLGQFDIALDSDNNDRNLDLEQVLAKDTLRIRELNRLQELQSINDEPSLNELTISELIVNTKDAWFGILDDLLDKQYEKETFTKDNRLFYVGITLIVFSAIIYIFISLNDNNNHSTNDKNIIYHIYENKPNL
jgi:hypothetical protein